MASWPIVPFLIEADAFIDDIFITPLEAMVHAAVGLDEFGQAARSGGVGDDRRAGELQQQDLADERDQAVAVDDSALRIHSAGAIHIRIKDDAQISLGCQHCLGNGSACLLILGVGDMVGEHAIRLEELAARGICAQGLQHIVHEETACTVTGIDDDLAAW